MVGSRWRNRKSVWALRTDSFQGWWFPKGDAWNWSRLLSGLKADGLQPLFSWWAALIFLSCESCSWLQAVQLTFCQLNYSAELQVNTGSRLLWASRHLNGVEHSLFGPFFLGFHILLSNVSLLLMKTSRVAETEGDICIINTDKSSKLFILIQFQDIEWNILSGSESERKAVLESKKDRKFLESTATAFWKLLQAAGYLLTGEGVRIGYKSSIHQRFSLSNRDGSGLTALGQTPSENHQ